MIKFNSMTVIKFLITMFFLFIAFTTITAIFRLNFDHVGLKFSVDSWTEEQVLMIVHSVWMSMLAVLCMGILAIWINFVFVRIIYNKEIREAAITLLRDRKKQVHPIDIYTAMIEKQGRKWFQWKNKKDGKK